MSVRRILGLLAGITALAAVPGIGFAADTSATQPAEQAPKFLRFVDDGPKGARLEAAEVTYRNKDGITLRLVSAVHIGETSYYDALQRGFVKDDTVLYEMVKPKGAPPPRKGQQSDHAVAQLQRLLRDKLNLDYQLDAIDYTRPNFVHADMDAETFMDLSEKRGETMASLMMQSLTNAMANPNAGSGTGDSLTDLMVLVAAPDPERQMKLMLARQMDDIEAAVAGLEGPNGSVILTERNKKVISVLQEQLKAGRKHLSIFYGAAHMKDLSQRIEALGFTPVDTKWVMAWDVSVRPDKPSVLQKWLGGVPATKPATPQ